MSGEAKPSDVDQLLRNSVDLAGRRDAKAALSDKIRMSSEGDQWMPAVTEAARFSLRLMAGSVSLAFLWSIFSRFVVPAIIESAYRAESLPFLNDIISGQAIHPVEHYLAGWEIISWRILGMLVAVSLIPLPLMATGPAVQRYLGARDENVLTLMPAVTNTVLALVGFTLVSYLYYLDPVGYVYFIAEDRWAEYGSFVSWAMASCFLSWMLVKDRGVRKPVFVLLALGTFLVAMEEISWGQRILGIASPAFFAESNLQGEINLHNLDQTIHWILTWVAITAIFLWIIVLPPLTTKWGSLRKWCDRLAIPIVRLHVWPLFLLAIFYHIYCPVLRWGELRELFLGIAVAILSLDLVLTMRRGARAQAAPATVSTACLLLTLGVLTAFLVRFYSAEEELRAQLNEFATKAFRKAGMYRQAEMVFDYVGRHPQFLTTETHFWHGMLLMRMGEHTKAKQILDLALVEQKRFQEETPEDPTPYRLAGQVLKLLERQEGAQAEFMHALEKDRSKLEQATDAKVEARVRWSMGRTLFASGDSAAASEELSMARGIADRRTQFLIDEWIRENLLE